MKAINYTKKYCLPYLYLFLSISGIVACSPGFDSNISMNPIIYESSETKSEASTTHNQFKIEAVKIRIGEILDKRMEKAVIEINDRKVYPKDNLSMLVEEGLKKRLKLEDFQHSVLAECKISGEITKWHAEVSPAFPTSEITAYAELKLVVSNNSKTFYTGTYSGENGLKHPNLSESKTSEILSEAMSQAIVESFKDNGFDLALANCSKN